MKTPIKEHSLIKNIETYCAIILMCLSTDRISTGFGGAELG